MSLIIPANTLASGGFSVGNSVRFNRGDSPYLSKTFSTDGTHHDKGTISMWVKKSCTGVETGLYHAGTSSRDFLRFESNDTLTFRNTSGHHLNTNRVFRDVSAFYNIVLAFDSSQGTASNRVKIYVNGVQETSFATETYPSQNRDMKMMAAELQRISSDSEGGAAPFMDGYLSEIVGIDGQQLTPTSFGEFDEDSGIFKPIDVSGLTFGTNGFYLNMASSTELGTDVSGNSNTFAETNLTAIDQSTDTCTNNFATLNGVALNNNTGANYITLSEGNLKAVGTSASNNGNAFSTIGFNTGKFYCEVKMVDADTSLFPCVGVITESSINNSTGNNGTIGQVTSDTVGYSPDGEKVIAGTESSYGDTFTNNDIIGIAIDCDNGAVYFSKNGTFQASGDPTSGASKTNAAMTFTPSKYYFFGGSVYKNTNVIEFNFGSPSYSESGAETDGNGYGNFAHEPPSGYYALNTKNLAEYG
jgi:hypothetical protein